MDGQGLITFIYTCAVFCGVVPQIVLLYALCLTSLLRFITTHCSGGFGIAICTCPIVQRRHSICVPQLIKRKKGVHFFQGSRIGGRKKTKDSTQSHGALPKPSRSRLTASIERAALEDRRPSVKSSIRAQSSLYPFEAS